MYALRMGEAIGKVFSRISRIFTPVSYLQGPSGPKGLALAQQLRDDRARALAVGLEGALDQRLQALAHAGELRDVEIEGRVLALGDAPRLAMVAAVGVLQEVLHLGKREAELLGAA